jgi:hypothetical protein
VSVVPTLARDRNGDALSIDPDQAGGALGAFGDINQRPIVGQTGPIRDAARDSYCLPLCLQQIEIEAEGEQLSTLPEEDVARRRIDGFHPLEREFPHGSCREIDDGDSRVRGPNNRHKGVIPVTKGERGPVGTTFLCRCNELSLPTRS